MVTSNVGEVHGKMYPHDPVDSSKAELSILINSGVCTLAMLDLSISCTCPEESTKKGNIRHPMLGRKEITLRKPVAERNVIRSIFERMRRTEGTS